MLSLSLKVEKENHKALTNWKIQRNRHPSNIISKGIQFINSLLLAMLYMENNEFILFSITKFVNVCFQNINSKLLKL